jgi:hypothetical protein
MIGLLRRLFNRPERHYPLGTADIQLVCKCGHSSPWDYNLRTHFEQTGRIGK